MTVTFDREKRLRYLLELEEPDVSPLAVPVHVVAVLRKHPEAGELLLQLAARLVEGVDRFDRARGGAGFEYGPKASTETDTELTLRLYPNLDPIGDPFGRVDAIYAMLAELAAKARTDVATTQDADLRARIAAELESPIPRSVAARLVITSTSS